MTALLLAGLGVAAVARRRQVDHFTKRHGLDWKVVLGGPTTLFVDRDRTVGAIHTGFNGPATGAEHARLKAEFERLTLEILASKP